MLQLEVIGNLGADCQVREDGGRKFYTFKVAETQKWKSNDGMEHEKTQWVSCFLNETLGNAVSQFLTKGRKVFVRGRADTRVYSSQIDRCMKAGLSLQVDQLELLATPSNEVPRQVIDPATGLIYDTYRAFYVNADKFTPEGKKTPKYPPYFVSQDGKQYDCMNGYLYEHKEQNNEATEVHQS